MQDYVNRLIRCGIPASDAVSLYKSMLRDFGVRELEELITAMERDAYVARVQS